MIAKMNKILDGLYLGSFEAANDTPALIKCKVQAILTAASGLEPMNVKVFTTYYLLEV